MDKVKQPTCIKIYNKHMGGVDLHDRGVNRYPMCKPLPDWHPIKEVVVAMLQLGTQQCYGQCMVLLQVHGGVMGSGR